MSENNTSNSYKFTEGEESPYIIQSKPEELAAQLGDEIAESDRLVKERDDLLEKLALQRTVIAGLVGALERIQGYAHSIAVNNGWGCERCRFENKRYEEQACIALAQANVAMTAEKANNNA